MKLLIAVPSKGRAAKITKDALRWLPRTGFDLRVFVEPQELEEYQVALSDGDYQNYTHCPPETLVDIGNTGGGLGFVKSFIKTYAEQHGYDLVFKIDDDVRGFVGRGRKKPDDQMIMDFCAMVGVCRLRMGESPEVGAIGFPYSFELWEPKKWSAVNARLQTCYLIRTELLQGGFNTWEDFAQYIHVRSKNKLTLRYGLLGIACAPIGKNKSGLQDFDRTKQAAKEAEMLKKIYPGIRFKKVDKPWGIEPDLKGEFYGIKKL